MNNVFFKPLTAMRGIRKRIAKNQHIQKLVARVRGWSAASGSSDIAHPYRGYTLYAPTKINHQPRPLIVALHGKNGTAYEFALTHITTFVKRHGYILACPGGENGTFYSSTGEQHVLHVIKDVSQEYDIDQERIYLLGFSMGGRGATYIGLRHSDVFAAIAPICGTSTGDELDSLTKHGAKIPVFVAHGTLDTVIPIDDSRELVTRLGALGYEYKFRPIEGLGHGLKVFNVALPEIFLFFNEHRRRIALLQDHGLPGNKP